MPTGIEEIRRDAEATWQVPRNQSNAERPVESYSIRTKHVRDCWYVNENPRQERMISSILQALGYLVPAHTEYGPQNFVRMRGDILELLVDSDPTARPSMHAFSKTWQLISVVGNQIKDVFPQGYVMEDGEGGIRIEWEHATKHIRLVIPAQTEGRHYIYHQHGNDYGVDTVSTNSLAGWLFWLVSA